MCLSILSPHFFRIKFLGESIFIDERQGKLEFTEVYDLFFSVDRSIEDLRLLAISPHNLLKDEGLCVEAVAAPGAGSPVDDVYKCGTGRTVSWSEDESIFSVMLSGNDQPNARESASFEGSVLRPSVSIPNALQEKSVSQILERSGTVFEIAFGRIEAEKDYAVRLRVKPNRLLGVSPVRPIRVPFEDRPSGLLRQDLKIYCPRTGHHNFTKLIQAAREQSKCAEAAGAIQSAIQKSVYSLLPIDEHRIVVIAPVNADIEPVHEYGWILPMGVSEFLGNGTTRRAAEWRFSTRMYFLEDIDALTKAIWSYLRRWGRTKPGAKTKEEVTAALNISHENCSLIIDKLVGRGVLVGTNDILFHAPRSSPDPGLFTEIASDPEIVENFRWDGYQITYRTQYQYLTPRERRRLRFGRIKNRWAFWLAILGILVSLAGLVSTWMLHNSGQSAPLRPTTDEQPAAGATRG